MEVSKSEHPAARFPALEVSKKSIYYLSVLSFDKSLYRFDLMFILCDEKDKNSDGKIAHYVLEMHQNRDPREQDGVVGQ